MNKTLDINLSGRMFHVDEDAYKLLYDYLYNLRHAFERQEGGNEIMDDLENRLAELLLERISDRQEVVSRTIVEEAITRLGRPEEIAGEENEAPEAAPTGENPTEAPADTAQGDTETTEDKTEEKTETPPPPPSSRKRLFRDPDNRILGGVLGGLALYLNWDPTLLRLLLVVILIAGYGTVIPIYLICWLIIPKATTAADKLSMRGQPITMENIGKMVTNGIESAGEYIRSDKPRTALQRFADALVSVIGAILKVALVLVGICCAPFLLVLLVVFIVLTIAFVKLFVEGSASLPYFLSEAFPIAADAGVWSLVCGISLVLGIALLVMSFLSGIFSLSFKWKGLSARSMKIMLILAAVCLVVAGVTFVVSGYQAYVHNYLY